MSLELFHPLVARWFSQRFDAPTAAQAAGWKAIAGGRDTLIAAPTGSGKTLAAFLWSVNALGARRRRAGPPRRDVGGLRLPAQGARQRHPAQPGGAARRAPPARRRRGHGAARDPRRRAVGRHARARAGADAQAAAAHPDHDPGIAVPAAHRGTEPRVPAHRAHGDRRRDPRGRRGQARHPSRALARAAGPAHRDALPAHRAQRDPEADRGDRAPPRRLRRRPGDRARLRDRRHRTPPPLGAAGGGARASARADRDARDVGGDLRPRRGARPRPPHDARVRQHAPARRARGAPSHPAARGGTRRHAPRQPVAPDPPRDRAAPARRRRARRGRDRLARARHRHRPRRSGLPPRRAARDRDAAPARGALGPRRRGGLQRDPVPADARRAAPVRRRGPGGAGGRARRGRRPGEAPRHPRAADRRHRRDAGDPRKTRCGISSAGRLRTAP